MNVSPLQVLREDLPPALETALAGSGLAPARLVLEVPEDRLLAGVEGPRALARLRALGVRVALGGFGTGYAGLEALQTLPLDLVKADQRFTAGLPGRTTSRAVVCAVVALARAAGLQAVVEGVETEQQAAVLDELGVPYAQGYLFGRPGPF